MYVHLPCGYYNVNSCLFSMTDEDLDNEIDRLDFRGLPTNDKRPTLFKIQKGKIVLKVKWHLACQISLEDMMHITGRKCFTVF